MESIFIKAGAVNQETSLCCRSGLQVRGSQCLPAPVPRSTQSESLNIYLKGFLFLSGEIETGKD